MTGWVINTRHSIWLRGPRSFRLLDALPCNASYWRVPALNEWGVDV